jgi:outer membrane protein OmpA-like peptidoglycan-associated protein
MRPSSALLTPLIPWLLALSSCSSPPKPPTVDESKKRPANAAIAIELQSCSSQLQNTRIALAESTRTAQTSAAALQAMNAARAVAEATPAPPVANGVYTVRFDFGNSRVHLPAETATALIEEARNAPLVLLRGRTDGDTDNQADSRVARERASAVRDYLVAAGVDPSRIRTTHQPAGDHAADNANPATRGLNRRVEIEVYRALPIAMIPAVIAQR